MALVDEQRDRYRDFLRRQFRAAGFLSRDPFKMSEALLQEVAAAVYTPRFEGRQSTYGALLLARRLSQYHERLPSFTPIPDRNAHVRHLADGTHVFYCEAEDFRGLISFDYPVVDELTAFSARDDALFRQQDVHPDDPGPLADEILLVRRDKDGVILALCREGVASLSAAHWDFRPYQYEYLKVLIDSGVIEGGWHDQIIKAILRMCVHLLGPIGGAGGTFVLLTSEDESLLNVEQTEGCSINRSRAFKLPWNPTVDERKNQRPIVHLLMQTDGAVVVSSGGEIAGIRCWLVPPASAANKVITEGGTRHLSAEAFSTGIKGLVFVVSADGPVTVYHNGTVAVSTEMLSGALNH